MAAFVGGSLKRHRRPDHYSRQRQLDRLHHRQHISQPALITGPGDRLAVVALIKPGIGRSFVAQQQQPQPHDRFRLAADRIDPLRVELAGALLGIADQQLQSQIMHCSTVALTAHSSFLHPWMSAGRLHSGTNW